MFRQMRRNRQQLPTEECIDILKNSTSGVLSVIGDDGYPYGVPLSYVYDSGRLYFHCAKAGHKLDAIKKCPKVSFCVVSNDDVIPEKYTTAFRSVIVFGKARILESNDEIYRSIYALAEKYNPKGSGEEHKAEIEKFYDALCMIEVEIEHMTGKEGLELAKMREKYKP